MTKSSSSARGQRSSASSGTPNGAQHDNHHMSSSSQRHQYHTKDLNGDTPRAEQQQQELAVTETIEESNAPPSRKEKERKSSKERGKNLDKGKATGKDKNKEKEALLVPGDERLTIVEKKHSRLGLASAISWIPFHRFNSNKVVYMLFASLLLAVLWYLSCEFGTCFDARQRMKFRDAFQTINNQPSVALPPTPDPLQHTLPFQHEKKNVPLPGATDTHGQKPGPANPWAGDMPPNMPPIMPLAPVTPAAPAAIAHPGDLQGPKSGFADPRLPINPPNMPPIVPLVPVSPAAPAAIIHHRLEGQAGAEEQRTDESIIDSPRTPPEVQNSIGQQSRDVMALTISVSKEPMTNILSTLQQEPFIPGMQQQHHQQESPVSPSLTNAESLQPPLQAQEATSIEPDASKFTFYGHVHRHYGSSSRPDEDVFNLLFRYPTMRRNGVFLEMNALDGIAFSNTKFFEDSLGWTGVLMERSETNYQKLLRNRPDPKVFKVRSAVCPEKGILRFAEQAGSIDINTEESRIQVSGSHPDDEAIEQEAPCKPLVDILEPMGFHDIDFWSIDVKGQELEVLKGTDFNRVHVRSILIENNIPCYGPPRVDGKRGENNLCSEILKKNGFCMAADWALYVLWVSSELSKFCQQLGESSGPVARDTETSTQQGLSILDEKLDRSIANSNTKTEEEADWFQNTASENGDTETASTGVDTTTTSISTTLSGDGTASASDAFEISSTMNDGLLARSPVLGIETAGLTTERISPDQLSALLASLNLGAKTTSSSTATNQGSLRPRARTRPVVAGNKSIPPSFKFYGQIHKYKGKEIVGRPDELVFNKLFRHPPLSMEGTFMEIGASDGIKASNTKFFEESLGWNGVLIEASSINYKKLRSNRKSRQVHKLFSAICPTRSTVKFIGDGATGIMTTFLTEKYHKAYSKFWSKSGSEIQDVPCAPLFELLEPIQLLSFDFVSLDVEGAELMVLQSTDFSKIKMRSILIESNPECKDPDTRQNLCFQILEDNGFCQAAEWDTNFLFVSGDLTFHCDNPETFKPIPVSASEPLT